MKIKFFLRAHNITRKLVGLLCLPILFNRVYSLIILVLSLCFWNYPIDELLFFAFINFICFAFIMGICGGLNYITEFLVNFLNIKYTMHTNSSYTACACFWNNITFSVNEKTFNTTIPVLGGNLYDAETVIKRKAIIRFLFNL